MNKKPVIIKKEDSDLKKHLIIVSKKYFKKAVERNRIKRIIREILRELIKNNNEKYKLIISPQVKNLSYEELKKEIKKEIN